jgi:hypothetical protein
MKCVKVESYVVEAGTDRLNPFWGGFAGSSNLVDANDRRSGQGESTVGGLTSSILGGCVKLLSLAASTKGYCYLQNHPLPTHKGLGLSVPASTTYSLPSHISYPLTCEHGTDTVFRNVSY